MCHFQGVGSSSDTGGRSVGGLWGGEERQSPNIPLEVSPDHWYLSASGFLYHLLPGAHVFAFQCFYFFAFCIAVQGISKWGEVENDAKGYSVKGSPCSPPSETSRQPPELTAQK